MADNDDQVIDDQGSAESTVEGGLDEGLLEDQGGAAVQSEEDDSYPFDPIDEATEHLILTDPDRGLQALREKVVTNQKSRDKAFTKKMSRLSEELAEHKSLKAKMSHLNETFDNLKRVNPDLFARVVDAVSGKDTASANADLEKINSKEDLGRFLQTHMQNLEERMVGMYRTDQVTREVDAFIQKNAAYKGKRDEIIEARNRNPDVPLINVAALVDPKPIVRAAERRKASSIPMERGLNERTAPAKQRFMSLEDAATAAVQEHGMQDS